MKKPVVLVVMDGVGETPTELGNMVQKATTPVLDELKATCPHTTIKAHGTAVGLPSDDDMGNSRGGPQCPRLRPDLFSGREAGQRVHSERQNLRIRRVERPG